MLDLLKEKYPTYLKSEDGWLKLFTEEARKEGELKTTFKKLALHYHTDKKPLARNPDRWGKDQERQEYLRDEIAKITNTMMKEIKEIKKKGDEKATDGAK